MDKDVDNRWTAIVEMWRKFRKNSQIHKCGVLIHINFHREEKPNVVEETNYF